MLIMSLYWKLEPSSSSTWLWKQQVVLMLLYFHGIHLYVNCQQVLQMAAVLEQVYGWK